ncbi:MAG: CCA tRNA nucleotidyltransferase [Candidatus Brocadiia bacterium]|jgi:poly(A) polymerase|nr:CCA tRNA nucleotidyltransferase [Candidatus Brocadiia bacterium]
MNTPVIQRPTGAAYLAAEGVVRRLQGAGHAALLAGGCVRDLLLGRVPKDYDMATSAASDEVRALFPDTRSVGARFGVTLVIADGMPFEVATFRTESGYSDGRRPDRVQFSGIEEDARRRDFTINGMYWDPVSGRLVDTVGGRQDLAAGVVRAVGNPEERMREDHLRLIRAVRFAGRLGFRIEEETERAVRALAPLIERIAAERLQQELRMILTDPRPAGALRMMDDLGMLLLIFPELAAAKGCEQPENFHPEGDVFVHSLLTVEKLGSCPDFALALAALLHDIGKPEASRLAGPKSFPEHDRIGREMAREICRRLRLSRLETDRVCWLIHRHMYLKEAGKMRDSTLKRLFAEPGFEELCELARADSLASWGRMDQIDYVLERRRTMPPETINPPPLVNGHDLIERGYKPGPAMGRVLEEVRERQLRGEITEREGALALAERIARRINAPKEREG